MANSIDSRNASLVPSWTTSPIWAAIESATKPDNKVHLLLHRAMPEIEIILTRGGTDPKDFTLHDAGHAFRVTKWMHKIIPPDVLPKLNEYELALLLLAAYLHDIGMTPEWGKVAAHRNYLFSGDSSLLKVEELQAFQEWLEEQEGTELQVPLQNVYQIDQLLTYYCRERHNEWSEQWIQEHLPSYGRELYHGWVDDLILVCKSHHFGYEHLATDAFDPRDLGSEGVVHRRYAAAVLRVADILENDPERTPDVLLRHRAVTQRSVEHWHKTHYLHQDLLDGKQLRLSATPPTALLHKAIEDTANAINTELGLCARLGRERPFEIHPLTGRPSLPHRWDLQPQAIVSIKDDPRRYAYIAGGFRPNTKKLLEMLSGMQLYGDVLSGVRELLQNAFDAVREQIAWQQLKAGRPGDDYAMLLARQHRVTLRLEVEGDQSTLVCRDDGAGMSKDIIRDYLLVSGESRRPDAARLRTLCKSAGVRCDRVGQFGIGVLSYFMLADHVLFRTRRSLEAETAEMTGWEFETWGVGSFGELRPATLHQFGTEVRLELKPQFHTEVAQGIAFYNRLSEFVRSILLSIPCHFELTSTVPNCLPIAFGPGWTMSERDRTELVRQQVAKSHSRPRRENLDLLPTAARDQVQGEQTLRQLLSEDCLHTLRWLAPAEGDLPSGIGRYRIHVPYFARPDGNCLGFLYTTRGDSGLERLVLHETTVFVPHFSLFPSWKGFAIRVRDLDEQLSSLPYAQNAVIELDFRSPSFAEPQVSRNTLLVRDIGMHERVSEFVSDRVSELLLQFAETNSACPYGWLNFRCAQLDPARRAEPFWSIEQSDARTWGAVRFPAISLGDPLDLRRVPRFRWRGTPVAVLSRSYLQYEGNLATITWHGAHSPDLVLPDSAGRLVPVWTQAPGREDTTPPINLSTYPPSWSMLAGAWLGDFGLGMVVNRDHPISQYVVRDCDRRFRRLIHPRIYTSSTEQLRDIYPIGPDYRADSDARFAVTWLLACANLKDDVLNTLWKSVQEKEPAFLPTVWELAMGPSAATTPIWFFRSEGPFAGFIVLSPSDSKFIHVYSRGLRASLPDPGPEWTLEIDSSETPR